MQFAVVALLAALVAVNAMPTDLFEGFVTKYNKVYATEEERAHRFNVFTKNLALIQERNAQDPSAQHGVNQFTDMTQEEFAGQYLMPRTVFAERRARMAQAPVVDLTSFGAPLPTTFDWRNNGSVLTPVKNQEQCGSCWAFSTTENIESVWALAGNKLVSLAPQQIVDCDTTDDGCNGGDTTTAYEYVIKAGGLEPETDYPYTAKDGKCKANSADFAAHITGYVWATKTKNETEMQVATLNVSPLSICVDAITWQTYTSGIITKNCGTALDHCVQISGWGVASGVEYWSIRNSWGESWGEEGYIRVERNKNLCGVAMEPTSATTN
jgi:cathepsin F